MSQVYIDSDNGSQKLNYALNISSEYHKYSNCCLKNQRLMQLAGPWVLIKVKTGYKSINVIKKAGTSANSVRDKKGLVSYPGMATPCSLQIAKNLSLYHLTAR